MPLLDLSWPRGHCKDLLGGSNELVTRQMELAMHAHASADRRAQASVGRSALACGTLSFVGLALAMSNAQVLHRLLSEPQVVLRLDSIIVIGLSKQVKSGCSVWVLTAGC